MLFDLVEEIRSFQAMGDHVVVYIDGNEDLRGDSPVSTQLHSLSLRETVLHHHGWRGPATYQRGRAPIDGVFVPIDLQTTGNAYLHLVNGLSDHIPVVVDVPFEAAFGAPPTGPAPLHCRRLQCRDPRVVRRYLDANHGFLTENRIYTRALALEEASASGLTAALQAEYEDIDRLRVEGMFQAEQRCQKLKAGKVAWSPAYRHAVLLHQYWTLFVKILEGCNISKSRLTRLRKRLGLPVVEIHQYTL